MALLQEEALVLKGSWYGLMLLATVDHLQTLAFHPCVASRALLGVFHSHGMLYSSVAVHLDPRFSFLPAPYLRLCVAVKTPLRVPLLCAKPSRSKVLDDAAPGTRVPWIPPYLDPNLDLLSVASQPPEPVPVIDAFRSLTMMSDSLRVLLFPPPLDRHPPSA
jgi:hypothetical protein